MTSSGKLGMFKDKESKNYWPKNILGFKSYLKKYKNFVVKKVRQKLLT